MSSFVPIGTSFIHSESIPNDSLPLIERFHKLIENPKFHAKTCDAFSYLMSILGHAQFTVANLIKTPYFTHLTFAYEDQEQMAEWLSLLKSVLEEILNNPSFDFKQLTDEEVQTVIFYNFRDIRECALKQKIAEWYLQEIQIRLFPEPGNFLPHLFIAELLKHDPRPITVDILEKILFQIPLFTLLFHSDVGPYGTPAILKVVIDKEFCGSPSRFTYRDYCDMVHRMIKQLSDKDLKNIIYWGLGPLSHPGSSMLFAQRLALIIAGDQPLCDRISQIISSPDFHESNGSFKKQCEDFF